MTQPAKQYQDLLKQLRDNVDQDLALYLNLMDHCWKKVRPVFVERACSCAKSTSCEWGCDKPATWALTAGCAFGG